MNGPRRAIVLAAGRGERLRPLTDATPKPLLRAGGRALIEWQVERLVAGGFSDIVVNHAHLGHLIEAALGDGARYGARIRYSPESPALETAGGIARALPLLGEAPFAVASADIHTDFDYASFAQVADEMAVQAQRRVAHLVLVENPPWHPEGDMGLANGLVTRERPWLTFASIGVFHPVIFRDLAPGTKLRLFPWAYRYADEARVTGEIYRGPWDNVGTAGQLEALDRRLSA